MFKKNEPKNDQLEQKKKSLDQSLGTINASSRKDANHMIRQAGGFGPWPQWREEKPPLSWYESCVGSYLNKNRLKKETPLSYFLGDVLRTVETMLD